MNGFTTGNINVGDKVIVYKYFYGEIQKQIGEVTKKTPTGLIDVQFGDATKVRFNRFGKEIGGDKWSRRTLEYATKEEVLKLKATMKRKQHIRLLVNTEWKNYNDETIEKIINILSNEKESED